MSLTQHLCSYAMAFAIVGAAATTASAQAPGQAREEAQRKSFIRGEAATRAPRAPQPANEAEALQQKRVTPSGIVEIPLPADRMVHLHGKVDADGRVVVGHGDAEHGHADADAGEPEVAHE